MTATTEDFSQRIEHAGGAFVQLTEDELATYHGAGAVIAQVIKGTVVGLHYLAAIGRDRLRPILDAAVANDGETEYWLGQASATELCNPRRLSGAGPTAVAGVVRLHAYQRLKAFVKEVVLSTFFTGLIVGALALYFFLFWWVLS